MRQRNTGAHPLAVPSLSVEVLPGEVIDYPDPITGLEPVDDDTVPGDLIRQVRDDILAAQMGLQDEPAAADEDPPDPDPDPKPPAAGGKAGRKPRSTPATADTEEA